MKYINKRGFTIIELMIALSVLSTILIISTTVVINLGNMYTKGINQINAQNTARNIVNELSSQLQLGGAIPVIPPVDDVFCLGSQRYNYRTNARLTNDSNDHVLWRDTLKNSGSDFESCKAMSIVGAAVPADEFTDPATTGAELLPTNMRLIDLQVADNTNGTYTILVTVAYGEDGPNDVITIDGSGRARCISGKGSEFCAVSSLTVIVSKRGIY